MAKISCPLTEIPIGKTEISVTEPGHPLIWTHRKSTGLIWRDPKFARPHWISCQKSIPFVCAQISGIATGQALQLLKKREIIAFFIFFKSESVYYLSRGEVKNAPWRENLDFPQLCFQQISELFSPRQFWRDLLLLDLSKGFLSELAQRCIERFVIFKRLGFHRKRVIIELCLDCMKQTTCCCSHKGWQQNSNRPHSQWYMDIYRTLSHEQIQKIRTQKIDETTNRCKFRIRKSVKISLWILNPGKIIFRIHWPVGPFTPLLEVL